MSISQEPSMVNTSLPEDVLETIDARLRSTDDMLASTFPGDDGRRQPVHTVYVPADRFTLDLPPTWGEAALACVTSHGGLEQVCAAADIPDSVAEEVGPRVAAKLRSEPIEDLRLDFEDGYGNRDDDEEDADAVRAANHLAVALAAGTAPPFTGIRFKCFEAPTRRRGIRTLDLFLTRLINDVGSLPDGFVVTFPKVSAVSQVEAMVLVCEELERQHGLPIGRLRFEIQVETPQLIVGPGGDVPIARAIHAARGRVTGLHYGTYDYSASLQIAAEYQASDHPAADFAKQVMQVAVAGTPVHLSDGSTNVLPVGSVDEVQAAWRLHAGLVRRALERGFYQGWDLHPHQLPTRYAATFAFYRESLPRALARLANYVTRTDSAILDEPATARALARFVQRGLTCGAVDEPEVTDATGLRAADVAALAQPRSDTENLVPLPR
jgi:citrate lyase beta subunit